MTTNTRPAIYTPTALAAMSADDLDREIQRLDHAATRRPWTGTPRRAVLTAALERLHYERAYRATLEG